jgi:hypothetical protein
VAMGEFHANPPTAVRHPGHRMGRRLPLVEVTDERDALGLWRLAEEIHQVERPASWLLVRRWGWLELVKSGVHK